MRPHNLGVGWHTLSSQVEQILIKQRHGGADHAPWGKGKTNLLLLLWKLDSANDGDINLIADYTGTQYSAIPEMDTQPVFIDAVFALDDGLVAKLVDLTEASADEDRVVV